MKKNGFAPLILLVVIAIVIGVTFYFVKGNLNISITPKGTPNASSASLNTINPNQESVFEGKLTKLNQDLKLFDEAKLKENGNGDLVFSYYSAGKFTKGDLSGYTRIIAASPPMFPGNPPIYTLATKDFKTYVLDDPDNLTKLPDTDYESPYQFLDKAKIVSATKFDTEQPKWIPLDNKYSLYLNYYSFENVLSGKKDSNNNPLYETDLKTDFSTYQKLSSPIKSLIIYFVKAVKPINSYILGDTKFIVVDSTGLPLVYSLTTPGDVQAYQTLKKQYDIDRRKAQEEHSTNFPTYPNPPHIGFYSSDITVIKPATFYKEYETAFPGPCAFDLDTRVVDVKDSDLEEIGSVKGLTIFKLKDVNNALNSAQLNVKLGYYEGMLAEWDTMNPSIPKPASAAEYGQNNPLLFVKDYWGRWIAVGEWDIKLPGGCGKPVIYLYPTKDTEVSLKFNAPIDFTTDIPSYTDSWKVLAHKDGTLNNLKTEDCSKYDGLTFGSEYAKNACLTNTYPYLYWSGNITSINYPSVSEGWVVAKSGLANFIDSKLTYMGLNEKERNDFESYWIPEMLSRNSNYYRVSFLNTQTLNQLFPMTVTPNPDTIFRIFMDWQPLDQKISVKPQTLEKLVRRGFTMVEWGGLK